MSGPCPSLPLYSLATPSAHYVPSVDHIPLPWPFPHMTTSHQLPSHFNASLTGSIVSRRPPISRTLVSELVLDAILHTWLHWREYACLRVGAISQSRPHLILMTHLLASQVTVPGTQGTWQHIIHQWRHSSKAVSSRCDARYLMFLPRWLAHATIPC